MIEDDGVADADARVDVPFVASIVHLDGSAVLRTAGEVDPSTAERFSQSIEGAYALSDRVVIDLAGVTFMDSSGLRVLVQAHQRFGQDADALALRGLTPDLTRLLSITGLDTLIPVQDQGSPPA